MAAPFLIVLLLPCLFCRVRLWVLEFGLVRNPCLTMSVVRAATTSVVESWLL